MITHPYFFSRYLVRYGGQYTRDAVERLILKLKLVDQLLATADPTKLYLADAIKVFKGFDGSCWNPLKEGVQNILSVFEDLEDDCEGVESTAPHEHIPTDNTNNNNGGYKRRQDKRK